MRRQVWIGLSVIMIAVLVTLIQASEYRAGFQETTITNDGSALTSIIDRTITYQGILKTNTGTPVPDNTYNLTFRIYKQSSGGSALWTSASTPVVTTSGYFGAQLGPISLPFDTTYYISIEVAGDVEMSRQMMTMSPYSASSDTANYAVNADMLDGQHASAFAVVGHTHVITSAEIQDGTIQFTDIGQNGAAGGQVMKWNGSSWEASNDSSGFDEKWSFRITDTADTTLISGGRWGLARNGNVLWGNADSTHINLGIQCTTGTSGHNYRYCTVGGGKENTSSNYGATVGGGYNNVASGEYATIGGGINNATASGSYYATVSGGYGNTASGYHAAVGGGISNLSSGGEATVSGGADNTASGFISTVGGGYSNTASGAYSGVAAGSHNTASGDSSFIGGGANNIASGAGAFIGCGRDNYVSGIYSCVPVGIADTVSSTGSMVFGQQVYCASGNNHIHLFNRTWRGRVTINRDDRDGSTNYPLQVGITSLDGNGAYLTNGGTWTNGSSRTFKENFTPFNGVELLQKISALSVTTYNYKGTTEKHVGPVAEEFVGAFDTGVIREENGKRDNQYLAASDVAGVALAGVQELIKIVSELKQENEKLKSEIASLKNQTGRE